MTAVPVIDATAYLAGSPEGAAEAARQLGRALEEVGFFFLVGHGLDWGLVEDAYEQAARLHAMADEAKERLLMDKARSGYLRLGGGTSYASAIAGEVRKPNLNAAFFVQLDDARNQWPALEGFRERVVAFFEAVRELAHRLLPLYALALDLPADYFSPHFGEPHAVLRMSHYPVVEHEEHQWGLAAHTDSSFMTLLAANDVPGLEIRPEGAAWTAPPALPRSFLVNSGDILARWTNDRFLSTAHRVLNASGRDRYAIPFFYGPADETTIAALPTCLAPGEAPRHEPITYGDYQRWFRNRNYAAYTGEPAAAAPP
ncbi:MAG: isopenicillin N synthase family dioxygenase [Acidimicrobiales bacterium]